MKTTILKRAGVAYLIRHTLFRCGFFSIKLHKVLVSDVGELHDHPWHYISLILWGGYFEIVPYKFGLINKLRPAEIVYNDNHEVIGIKKWYAPGSLLFRKANVPHKLELKENQYCLSLIITSPKLREWGFLKNKKWVSHKQESY